MAKQITTSIQINARKETIWRVLTDFEKFAEWNTFIESITGNLGVGNRLIVKLQGMTFKPIVLVSSPNKELRWVGRLGIRGLFDGEHRFEIIEHKDGSVSFHQIEKFSGILVGLFSKSLDKKTKPGFEQMNIELKQRAEAIEKQ